MSWTEIAYDIFAFFASALFWHCWQQLHDCWKREQKHGEWQKQQQEQNNPLAANSIALELEKIWKQK